ncbi:MAG: heavy metal-associated domain-containing protein [Sporomusaceae bacterium]|nr:heavy metal-associated domain-containing protein [Sporomusaceae bacterium]
MCKTCGCAADTNIEQTNLSLKGLNLINALPVKKSLLGLPGVYHVHVHAFSGKAVVDYNPAKTPLTDIVGLLTDRGLEVSY